MLMLHHLSGRRGILIYCYQAAASLALFFYSYFILFLPSSLFSTARYAFLRPGDPAANLMAVIAVLLAVGNLVPPHLVVSNVRSIHWQVIALVTHAITAMSTGFILLVIATLAILGAVEANEVPMLSMGYGMFGLGYLAVGVMRPYLDPTFSQIIDWILRERDADGD